MKYLLTAASFLGLAWGTAAAEMLDPKDPDDQLTIARRVICSTEDGKDITYYWSGDAYSRRMGERDKLLFKVVGMNVRACSTVEDKKRGTGFKSVSREILLYLDPKTGKVLKTWDNPWSEETVEVYHVSNDPVNFELYEKQADGKPYMWPGSITNDVWYQRNTVPLYYPNPLGGKYQVEVGGTYHATEMFNFFGDTTGLLDTEVENPNVHVSWERMSDWLPWMKMAGREGLIYFHTAGLKLDSWDEMPELMKSEIRKHYPEYAGPPPLDDDRRNVTSWSWYADVKEGRREPPNRK